MAKKMLIDATHPEETRVVVVDGQKVEDFDFESITKRQLAGNIYLAKVTRVEPSLQAAFVEYGGNRHGFLAFSEVHPDYYQIPVADREALLAEEAREEEERKKREDGEPEDGGRARRGRNRKSRSKPKKDAAAAASVAGLEVIDLDEETDEIAAGSEELSEATNVVVEDAPVDEPASNNDEEESDNRGSAERVADAPASDSSVEPEIVSGNDVAAAQASTEDAQPNADVVEDPAQDDVVDAEDGATASDGVGEDDLPPKSIAESAGLDDEERVTGEIGEPDGRIKPAETDTDLSETATAEPDQAGADSVPESPEPHGQAEPKAATEDNEASTSTPAEASATDDDSADNVSVDADEDTATASKPEDSGEDEDGKTSRRRSRRRRGSRSKKADDAETEDTPETDDDASEGEDIDTVGAEDTLEEAARARTRLRRRYKIQDVIKVRQILLVQVVKEERGNKGAALTTYLSLAGRYCVLMPNTARGGGISRKITNAPDRKRLREVIGSMDVPTGMGLIVRTAGAERTKAEIKRDYEFLIRQWEQIRELTLKSIAPTLIYEEGSLIKRSIRDIYSREIDQILVEGDQGYREAKEYMKMLMPSHAKNVQPYADQIPLFSRYQVESYLNGMFNPTVQLRSGGYIVIGITEALVAIDVNSGRATKQGSIEETAVQTNLEAADEVARQLRLRDLAGLIVIDFIDMDENRNNRAVEKRMKDRLKNDRARIQVGRISAFGLMEMSRQRLRPGMLEATTQPCPHCLGVGLIRSDENLSLSILREVEEEAIRGRADEVSVRAPIDVANYLINHKRPHIAQLEARHGIAIAILADPSLVSPNFEIDRSKSSTPRPARQSDVVTSASVIREDAEDAVIESPPPAEERDDEEARSRRRRGKRGGRRKRGDQAEGAESTEAQTETETPSADEENDDDRPRSRRGRGRRRGGRGKRSQGETETAEVETDSVPQESNEGESSEVAPSTEDPTAEAVAHAAPADEPIQDEPVTEAPIEEPQESAAPEAQAEVDEVAEPDTPPEPVIETPAPEPEPQEPPKPKRRGWWSFGG